MEHPRNHPFIDPDQPEIFSLIKDADEKDEPLVQETNISGNIDEATEVKDEKINVKEFKFSYTFRRDNGSGHVDTYTVEADNETEARKQASPHILLDGRHTMDKPVRLHFPEIKPKTDIKPPKKTKEVEEYQNSSFNDWMQK